MVSKKSIHIKIKKKKKWKEHVIKHIAQKNFLVTPY